MSVNGNSGFLYRVFSLAFAIILSGAPYVHSVRAEPAPDVLPQAAADFINSGSATYSVDGSVGTVDQATNRASLNWDSFNIGSRATVNFVQPGTDSVTFNHIAQQDPSQIFGALNANGKIFLINQNGFIFGSESQVDVNSLVVSTLQMNDRIEEEGLQAPANARETAFALFGTGETGEIVIEDGAQISAQNGGRVFMFAPTVTNQGEIRTPEGQAMLAAGESVYLTNDTDLRGFLVEVGVGGEVVNGSEANASATNGELIGKIIADKGSVTLAGLAVKQNGLVSANTGVNANGQIRLQARDGGQVFGSGDPRLRASNSGTLTLGENSKTHANPDESETETALDSAEQLAGDILLYGDQIIFENNSEVVAHGGNIQVQAQALPTDTPTLDRAGVVASNSLIQLGENVRIDASGLNIEKDIRSNLLTVDLRSDELKDVPLQRNGVLKDATVVVDIRQHGTREDGSVWEGTPVADISDRISTIGRTVAERSLAGGSVTLQSQGAVVVDESAVVDVSGGSITFTEGRLNTTLLQSANGPSVEISQADPNVIYDGIVNRDANDVEIPLTPGYTEGKDAGSIQVNAFQSYLHGSFRGGVVTGIYQQNVAKSLATITDFDAEITRLYRPFDEAPSGGELILGQPIGGGESIFRYDEVSFVNQLSALPDIASLDPTSDPNRVEVGENILQGFEHVKAFAAEGNVEEGVVLDVGPGGSAEFEFRNFDMRGAIFAPGGKVSILNPDGNEVSPGFGDGLYTFSDTAKIDVSGRWVNQSRASSSFENPIAIDAGSIRVDVGGGVLNIAENASFDASAGALLRTGSKLDIGSAGSITISAESFDQPLQLGDNFFAYGINGSSGGELDITVTSGACVGATACSDANAQRIDPAYLTAGGFSKKKLTFTAGGVDIQAGTQINLQSRTRELDVLQALNAVSGSSIESISSVVTPAQIAARSAVDLSLVAAGDVILNDGAQILADPGAEVSLFSDSSIYVGGDIVALGGTVDLELGSGNLKDLAPDLVDAYDATQTIWLGEDSSIDVSGTTIFDPANRNGLVRGKVFDGGTVNVEAKRGFVFIDQGARVNADAVSAVFAERIGSNLSITPYLVAGDGGTVNVFTADGYVNRGDVSARAAIPGISRAGTFNLTIDAGARGALARQEASGFPGGDRVVVLTPDQSPYLSEDLSFGDALPNSLIGKAIIDQEQITDGRFDNLTVRANAYSQRRLVAGLPVDEFYQGVVEFDDGLD